MKTRAAAKIRVQYRPDSYGGPTVVVDLHDEMGLHGLRDIFFRLATGELSELDLQEQESVAVLSPIERFTLRTVQSGKEPRRRLLVRSGNGCELLWMRSREGWEDCVLLMSGFMLPGQRGRPGHQYLNGDSQDDAVIEVRYREG